MVGLNGLEPSTSRLSGVRSNQLSYRPTVDKLIFLSLLIKSSLKIKQLETHFPFKPSSLLLCTSCTLCHSRLLLIVSVDLCLENIPALLRLLRKEVIQPHLPIRLPCYDFTPIIRPTFDGWLLTVTPPASGVTNFRGVTGGVYKARERIHRSMLTCDY